MTVGHFGDLFQDVPSTNSCITLLPNLNKLSRHASVFTQGPWRTCHQIGGYVFFQTHDFSAAFHIWISLDRGPGLSPWPLLREMQTFGITAGLGIGCVGRLLVAVFQNQNSDQIWQLSYDSVEHYSIWLSRCRLPRLMNLVSFWSNNSPNDKVWINSPHDFWSHTTGVTILRLPGFGGQLVPWSCKRKMKVEGMQCGVGEWIQYLFAQLICQHKGPNKHALDSMYVVGIC